MEENKQIIYHKSDWGTQVIKIVFFLGFIYFSYQKNPTKELFIQEIIREYSLKKGWDYSSSAMVSELSSNVFGGFAEPFVKRNDYIIFSTYEIELDNQYISGRAFAIGFWDSIIMQENQLSETSDVRSVKVPIPNKVELKKEE